MILQIPGPLKYPAYVLRPNYDKERGSAMQIFLRRAVWFSVWAATYSIIVWLCIELAENQPVILAVLLLSGFVASVGLVYARQSFAAGAWSAGLAAIFVSALALTTSVIGEISYWSGSIETIHEQVTRDKSIADGKSLVRKRQAERYSALSNGQSAEQLQAAMAGSLAKTIGDKTIGARTKDCTDTASYHYGKCSEYLNLKAQFAAASEAARLEGMVGSFNTAVEPVGLKRDFYRAAVWVSDVTGWKVESCIAGIAAIIVSLLQALLMLSLYIGAAPDRRQEARTAAKAPKGMEVAPLASSPPLTRTARSEMAPWVAPSRKTVAASTNLPENPVGSPDDTPPPADAKPVAGDPGAGGGGAPVKVAGPVLVTEDWKPEHSKPLSKKQRKQMERERLKDDAIRAVEEFASARLDLDSPGARFVRSEKGFVKSGGTPGDQLGKEFRQWAKSTRKWVHFATYNQNPLGKAMSAVLEAGRPTNGCGAVYAALVKQEQRRAVAA